MFYVGSAGLFQIVVLFVSLLSPSTLLPNPHHQKPKHYGTNMSICFCYARLTCQQICRCKEEAHTYENSVKIWPPK